MAEYLAYLRYYVGDPLEEINQEDLDRIGQAHGVELSFERIDKRTLENGLMREETLDKALEEITQDIIKVVSDNEADFRRALAAIYDRYRSPRTTYGFWGSSPEGQRLAKDVAEKTGGGW